MTMLAELNEKVEDPAILDAAVGGDTHRDTHYLEMLTGAGVLISRITIDNDADGYAEALAWIAEHTPGPRVLIGLEGTRSYGIGLCRALQAAGLEVVEAELMLADLASLERRVSPLRKKAQSGDKDARIEVALMDAALKLLSDGKPARLTEVPKEEEALFRSFNLLTSKPVLYVANVEEAAQHKALLYDKAGEEHYNVISAFIKSLRGSDPDAAVYWLVRMLEAGEPPRFI